MFTNNITTTIKFESAVKCKKVETSKPLEITYSSVLKMCVSKDHNSESTMDKCQNLSKNLAGKAVRGVLAHAKAERRLTCGLLPAIDLLESDPCSVMFCVVAESTPGDATSHMHTVLLQAFCYENDIPVIQVDNSEKLAHFCGLTSRKGHMLECALVTRSPDTSWDNPSQTFSKAEQTLNDFYECTFYDFPKPTIILPPLS